MNNKIFHIFSIILIYNIDGNFALEKGLIQKGNLICHGNIKTTIYNVEDNRNMNSDSLTTKDAKSSITSVGKTESKKITLENIKNSIKDNSVVKINSYLKVTGSITYEEEKPKPKRTESFAQVSNSELDNLSSTLKRPRDYFTNPNIDFDNLSKMSFLQMDNIFINNVKQWALIKEIDISNANKNFTTFVLENLISKKIDNLEINQSIKLLKENKLMDFNHVMIELNFKFLNILWNNSTAYIKINEEYHWMEHHDWETSDCNMDYWVSPIRIIMKKKDVKNDQVNIVFGIKPNLNAGIKLQEKNVCGLSIENIDLKNKNIVEFINLKISTK